MITYIDLSFTIKHFYTAVIRSVKDSRKINSRRPRAYCMGSPSGWIRRTYDEYFII